MDYKFGNKNNWRRTTWNRIAERLTCSAHEALVLYLAGEKNLDCNVAALKGFDRRNLIAVERDEEVIRQLRNTGALAVRADFIDVVRQWPGRLPVAVVLGDFCCGLELRLWTSLSIACLFPQVHGAVFAFNFLRGRDPSGNTMRAFVSDAFELSQGEKHRGGLFFVAVMSHLVVSLLLAKHPEWCGEDRVLRVPAAEEAEAMEYQKRMVGLLEAVMKPTFDSYRSKSGQIFDSVVFRSPLRVGAFDASLQNELRGLLRAQGAAAATRRKISAVLAHRTMRMQ